MPTVSWNLYKPVLFFFQGENADERVKAAREAVVPGGNIKQFIEKDLAAKQHYLAVTKVKSSRLSYGCPI